MCGRDAEFYTWAQVHAFSQPLTLHTPIADPQPRFNRAPGQLAWVLANIDDSADAAALRMRWGLVPHWAKDPKIAYTTINARAETASSKPAFRDAWKRRRCLVPSSGYYEWKILADGKQKQPHFIHDSNGPVLMFAGLWERWQGPQGAELLSYSIVTQAAAGPVSAIHDRMPLILPPSLLLDWLKGSASQASEIVVTAPLPALSFHPVARDVGNARNEGHDLILPLA